MDTINVVEADPPLPAPEVLTGSRDVRQPYEKQLAVYLILASILFENTGFLILDYNIGDSLNNSTKLHWSSAHGTTASNIFDAITLVAMLVFAIICDAKVSRARIILIGFSFLTIGLTLFTVILRGTIFNCCQENLTNSNVTSMMDEKCAPSILTALVFAAIGDGAVRANIIVFGADQLPHFVATSRYLDKYLICATLASIIMTAPSDFVINYEGYPIYLMTATAMVVIAAVLFLLGWRYYIHVKPYDTVIINCFPVYKNAFRTWREYRRSRRSIQRRPADAVNTPHNLLQSELQQSEEIGDRPSRFLDFAKTVNNGKYLDRIVNDVKSLQSAIVLFILILPYRLVSVQLYKTFPSQAESMKPIDSNDATDIDISILFTIEFVTIIIGVIILNKFVYKCLLKQRRSLAIGIKFVISMCFAVLVMLVAGFTEVLRHEMCPREGNATISNLHIYAEVPQCIGLGIAQTFGLLASLEFAYFIAPRSAQSLFMSLHFIARILSEDIVDGYMNSLSDTNYGLNFSCKADKPWLTKTYFFTFAGVLLIFIVIFVLCQKYYRIITLKPEQVEQLDFTDTQ